MATLILSSPPSLKLLASSAISFNRLNLASGFTSLFSSMPNNSFSLAVMVPKEPDKTASSSLRSLMDRVIVGGSASMQSEKVVHTRGQGY